MNPFSLLNSPGFDYVVPANPTVSVNPSKQWATWLNSATGELFVCLNRTTGANKWRGQAGTIVIDTSGIDDDLLWHMDYPSGTTLYAKVGSNLTITSGYGWNDDLKKIHFDEKEYATLPDDIFRRSIYSTSVWVSCRDLSSGSADFRRTIFSDDGNRTRLEFSGATYGAITYVVDDGSSSWPTINTPANTVKELEEVHVVTTFNAGSAQLFVNGILAASGSLGSLASLTSNTYLGRTADVDRNLRGTIRDFRIYSTVTSQEKIEKLYAYGKYILGVI